MKLLSRWYSEVFRRGYSALRRLDQLDLPLFAAINPKLKSRWMRRLRRLLSTPLSHIQEIEGVRLEIPQEMHHTYVVEAFEPRTRALLRQILEPGMHVVDVGANIGLLTAVMAQQVGPEGEVWAIEPEPANVELLRRNLALNGLEDRVTVVAKAAGATTRSSTLHLTAHGTGHSLHSAVASPETGVPVEVRPLDGLINGPVDLVKIDVEGGELDVLAGMESILRESPGLHLIVEWNPAAQVGAGCSTNALPEYLARLGFDLELIPECRGPGDLALAIHELEQGRLPERWYANLHGTRPSSEPESADGNGPP